MKYFFRYLCIGMLALLCVGCSGKQAKPDDKNPEKAVETEKPLETANAAEEASQYFEYEVDTEKKYVTIISCLQPEAEEIIIPEYFEYEGENYPVTTIAEEAFYGNDSLKHISIPNSVTKIDKDAFCGCEALEEIEIPGTVVTMGTGLFFDCSALKKVTIGEGIVNLPDEIFTNCYALEEVKLPSTIVSIGKEAFWGCSALQEINFPKTTVMLGERCLYSSGVKTLTMQSPAVSIYADMFEGMDTLETIYVPETLVSSVADVLDNSGDVEVKAIGE